MKNVSLVGAAAIAMLFASCAKNDGEVRTTRNTEESAVGYMSIGVTSQRVTRASIEDEGVAAERKLSTLYLITFDADDKVVPAPGTSALGYTKIDVSGLTDPTKPDPVRVDTDSKQLVVVANPGPELAAAIEALTSLDTYDDFNAVIAGVETSEIVGDNGFTMMSTRSDNALNTGDKISSALVAIGADDIKVVVQGKTEAEVITDAAADRLTVNIERLAGKLALKAADPIAAPDYAEVALTAWTVDAVNSTFHPFAEKTILGVGHTAGDYLKNFYTEDPNFTGAAGLVYTKINNPVDEDLPTLEPYDPILPWATTEAQGGYYGWISPDTDAAYVIENTMAPLSQLIANSTRVVMKATYYPEIDGYTNGTDWFSWAGDPYATLDALQAAYAAAEVGSNLKDACDAFYGKLDLAFPVEITADGFATLTQDQLDAIPNGGEVVKDGTNPVIRWYQDGRCYYSYEVQHDNDQKEAMMLGKYGVVRNNWYDLTLASVAGPGTPWYPDPNNPGDGDPDPTDPIDPARGYIGVEVNIMNWVWWQTPVTEVD